jgi:3'-phosphoadenosine 5'-phosphosulfate sulfotransferase (PAPS reductase)/FAD synthetase
MNSLESDSIKLIRECANKAKKPAMMCSFGKDSMCMASLIRESLLGLHGLNGDHFPLTHGFPIPVIYHRDPWFPVKHDFADRQIRTWAMEVYDFPPLSVGLKTNDKLLELVSRYQLGSSGIDLPKNVMPPEAYPRRDFICGLRDWVGRPTAIFEQYPWDLIFLAHKDSDVDPFEGPVPLKSFTAEIGGVKLVFPLKDWTDENLWDYIEAHHVPVQENRYDGRNERADKWYSNDYIHACCACIDPRQERRTVFCPKLKRDVPNVAKYVIQFQSKPPYIDREVSHARQ